MSHAIDVKSIAARPVPDPDSLPERPTRILVADDEHLVAAEVTLKLADLGFTTIGPAADGRAALELAEQAMPHMALLDIRMPKMDGLEAAHAMFHQLAIPCIILSAYSEPDHIDMAERAGVFHYLVKPVKPDQLNAAIQVAWGRYRALVACSTEAKELAQKLEDRKVIERAKWALVSSRKVDEPEAMRLLQKQARDGRRPLIEVANSVLQQLGL